jgi:hypothetical protein
LLPRDEDVQQHLADLKFLHEGWVSLSRFKPVENSHTDSAQQVGELVEILGGPIGEDGRPLAGTLLAHLLAYPAAGCRNRESDDTAVGAIGNGQNQVFFEEWPQLGADSRRVHADHLGQSGDGERAEVLEIAEEGEGGVGQRHAGQLEQAVPAEGRGAPVSGTLREVGQLQQIRGERLIRDDVL